MHVTVTLRKRHGGRTNLNRLQVRLHCLLSIIGMFVIPSARHSNVADELMTAVPAAVCIMKCPTKKDVYARVSGGSYIGRSTAGTP